MKALLSSGSDGKGNSMENYAEEEWKQNRHNQHVKMIDAESLPVAFVNHDVTQSFLVRPTEQ